MQPWRRMAGRKPDVAPQMVGQVVGDRASHLPCQKARDQRTQHTYCAVIFDQVVQQVVQPDGFGMIIGVHHGLYTGRDTGPLGLGCG